MAGYKVLGVFFALSLMIMLGAFSVAATDLIVNSGTTVLGGHQSYGYVYVANGATLQVNSSIGFLNLSATQNITILGTIDGYAMSNYSGGSGGSGGGSPNGNGAAGNAGQGYSGKQGTGGGGAVATSTGGSAGGQAGVAGNSTDRYDLTPGSGGGGGGGGSGASACCDYAAGGSGNTGGKGGAAIRLNAPKIFISGIVDARGGAGGNGGAGYSGGYSGSTSGGGGGGGAAAGQIIIDGYDVNITGANLKYSGGSGGTGGSARGGSTGSAGGNAPTGYAKIFYGLLSNSTLTATGTVYYYDVLDANVNLVSPVDQYVSSTFGVTFDCSFNFSGSDSQPVANVSLWTDKTGVLAPTKSQIFDSGIIASSTSSVAVGGSDPGFPACASPILKKNITIDGYANYTYYTTHTSSGSLRQGDVNLCYEYDDGTEACQQNYTLSTGGDKTFYAPNLYPQKKIKNILAYLWVEACYSGSTVTAWDFYVNGITFKNLNFSFFDSFSSATSWTCEACTIDNKCYQASEIRSFSIDATPPTITIYSPSGYYNFGKTGTALNLTLNISEYTRQLWYNYAGVNVSLADPENRYTYETHSSYQDVYGNDGHWNGQTFTTGNTGGSMTMLSILGKKKGSPSGSTPVYLYATSAGLPTGAPLATGSLSASSLPTNDDWINVSLAYTLSPNTMYAFIFGASSWDGNNNMQWERNNTGSYPYGTMVGSSNAGSTWATAPDDGDFRIIGLNDGSNQTYFNVTFNQVYGYNNLTIYALDFANNLGITTASWDYLIGQSSITYQSSIIEGSLNSINGTFTLPTTPTAVVLTYNGLNYTPTITASGNSYQIVGNVISPSVTSDQNISFYYIFNVGGQIIYTDVINQTVLNVGLSTNCSAGNFPLLNITNYNEETLATMNASVEYVLQLVNNGVAITTMSGNASGSSISLCTTANLSQSSANYNLQLRHFADGFAYKTYNIQNGLMSAIPLTIPLYNINNSVGTQFKINYVDFNYLTYPGAIVQIQRQYLTDNTYKLVEIPKISSNGQATGTFNANNIRYKVIIVYNGNILDTFDDVFPVCQNIVLSTCELNLRGTKHTTPAVTDDFTYTLTKTSSNLVLTYVIPSGTPKTIGMETQQNSRFLQDISDCNSSLFASGGTIACGYNATIGDSVINLQIKTNGNTTVYGSVQVAEDLSSFYLLNNYLIAFILLLVLLLIFISSGVLMVLISAVGVLFLGVIFLIKGVSLGLMSISLAWLIVAAVIIIYKIGQKEERT